MAWAHTYEGIKLTQRTDEMLQKEVLSAYRHVETERDRKILTSVIRHIFALAKDISLTRDEWRSGLRFLNAVGQKTTKKRDEFILLSDVLGLSALVEIINGDIEGASTPGSSTGPFHADGSPFIEIGETINLDSIPGAQTVFVSGRVVDVEGRPVENAVLDIWQTAPNRLYAVQDEDQTEFNLRAKQRTNKDGHYGFITCRPVPYSIPRDGPCGAIINASKGHGMRAAHIHISVNAPRHVPLVTEIFDRDDPYTTSDAVFGTCERLLANYGPNLDAAIGAKLRVDFDVTLKLEAV